MEGGKNEMKDVNSTQTNKGQKRCKRCSLFLNADEWEQTKCIYHPGTYKELAGKDWDSGWSCCRKELSSTLQISDFKKYQAPMPPLPKMPTVKEYLHEATRKAASQFDEIMKQQQGQGQTLVDVNNQPKLEFKQDISVNQNENQSENLNVQMPNGDVINVDFSTINIDMPESSVYSYSVTPVDVNATPVSYSVTPVTVTSSDKEEEVEEIDVTPISVNVNVNQHHQHHHHHHHDQSNEVLSSPRLSNTFDSPITSTESSPLINRSTSPDVNSNSIVTANNLNLPEQHYNPRYQTHSSIVLSNGNASIVEVDPNANHVLIPFDNLTYIQKNQLLQQWDNQVVEYYIGKRHEKEDDKTMTLDEKMRFRDDPMLSPFSKESIGCTIVAHHVEDLEYSTAISNFPIVNTEENARRHVLPQEILQKKLGDTRNPLPEGLLSLTYSPPSSPPPTSSSPPPFEESNVTPSEKDEINNDDIVSSSDEEGLTEEEKEKKRKKKEKIPDFFIHKIETGDTLVGISLKYGVVVEDLLRINFLNRSNLLQISHLKQIKVPTNGKSVPRQTVKKPSKNEIIQEFCRKTKSTSEEAKYYLEENSWDVDDAADEFQKDKEWEKENETKYKGSKFLEPLPIGREAKEDFKRKNCLCVK